MVEYSLFKPQKYADDAEWKLHLEPKAAEIRALEKAGAEGRAKLECYLGEVVWAVLRSELSVARGVELLSKTRIPARESLQRLFADVLWLVGFAAIEQPQNTKSEMKEEFAGLCLQLEKEAVLPRPLLALSLETESVPQTVCQVATLKKKVNQAKTKARYTITRFNLLREHSEGYAKLLYILDRLVSLEWRPEATREQAEQSQLSLVEDVVRLAGFGYLCPNRIVSMALDVYEQFIAEGNDALAQPLLALMRRFPTKRLTEVAVFQLLAHYPAPSSSSGAGSRDSRKPDAPAPVPAPTDPHQFLAMATLISMDMLDIEVLWSYLEPTDASIKQGHAELLAKYDDDVSKLSKVDLGASSASSNKNDFGDALQALNQSEHQKFRLTAALVSVNAWRHANRVLLHLSRLCKPALNHHVRSALCDLLKWLISPMLKPQMKRQPKVSLDSSFRGSRRFNFGVKQGSLGALQPITDFEQLIPQIRQVLDHLEYFLHTDLHLLSSLLRVLSAFLTHRKKASGKASGNDESKDDLNVILFRHILPAVSLVAHNPHLSDMLWEVMKQFSVFQRYLIYSCWETTYDSFLLKLAYEKTKHATKQILKRVVSNAEKKDLVAHQSHFHFGKLCHANPIPALETMLKDVEIGFNVNMLQPYVECTNRCSEMTADVMGFLFSKMCSRPVTRERAFLSQKDATLSPWLVNLGEFVGRFYKKHPHTDLHGLLTCITKRINSEVAERVPGSDPVMPQSEYKGESLIRVILEYLIEYMGSYSTVADMTAEQLLCLAGGPRLRGESISFGKKEESGRKDRARNMLFSALTDLGLVRVLWYSLSQQSIHFLSEEFSEAHSGGGLKLLGLLFDGINECFLKLTEFLAQACTTREKYLTLIPPFQEVFSMFMPSLAFLAIRPGLPVYGRAVSAPAPESSEASASAPSADAPAVAEGSASATPAKASESGAPQETDAKLLELEQVVRWNLPPKFEADGLSVKFYMTFWRLSLQDILVPNDGYERTLNQISQHLKQMETQKKEMEKGRSSQHTDREYKALKKESQRVIDLQDKLKTEWLAQKHNHQQVLARLEQEKDQWFVKPGPDATIAFVQHMIYPRVMASHADTLFCCHFVRLLLKLKTPGFQLLDFYNQWTVMLTQSIRCCSEREAQIFGVFLRESMSYVLALRKDEDAYAAEIKGNPCFYRNYYVENQGQVEWTQFKDFGKGHAKWEGRIHKGIRQGMESEDWMEKRNALLLLSQSYESFPVVEKYAGFILQEIGRIRDTKDGFADLKTLAGSLAVKLKSRREFWVDKQPLPDPKAAKDDRPAGKTKNALAPQAKADEPKASGEASKSDRDRDRHSSTKRPAAEEPTSAEKRSRREEDPTDKRADKRAGKDEAAIVVEKERKEPKEQKEKESKEARESKEAKSSSRTDSKAPKDKEVREVKETRDHGKESKTRVATERPREKESVEKQRTEKDRDREKAPAKSSGDKDAREGERKRSSGSGGGSSSAPQPPPTPARHADAGTTSSAHDDRGSEKRRRTEREPEGAEFSQRRVTESSDRGASDRHGSSGSHSHQPRNALAAAPDSGSSQYHSGSRQPQGHHHSRHGGSGGSSSYPAHSGSGSGGSSRYAEPPPRRR